MYGGDPSHRSLAASPRLSRQVDIDDPAPRSHVSVDEESFPPPPAPAALTPVESPGRRRLVGQGVALLVLGMVAWTVVTASDSTVMRGEIGSDEALSGDRAALVRLLDGVVAHVEVGTADGAGSDRNADFGAGAKLEGTPPAAPGSVGRRQPTPDGDRRDVAEPAPLRAAPDEPLTLAMPEQNDSAAGQGADVAPAAATGDGDLALAPPSVSGAPGPVATAAPTIRTSTTRRTTSTRRASTTDASGPTSPPNTGSPTVTTVAVTTTSTTVEPTLTTAAVTTTSTAPPPAAVCVVVVARPRPLRAAPEPSAGVLGQSSSGTFTVLERHGQEWFRIGAGWLRQGQHVTPENC